MKIQETGHERSLEPENKNRIPLAAKIFYILGALSVLLYIAFLLSESFSDFFNRYISSIYRAVMAYLTSWIGFSLAETILLSAPIILVACTIYATKRYGDSWRGVGTFCISIFSVIVLLFSTFTVGFAAGYRGTTLDKKLGIERRDVSAEELYATAEIIVEKMNEQVGAVAFVEDGFSVMPYGYETMNALLLESFESLSEEYDFLPKLSSRVKPVMLSEPMSYTHITGVYTFFTGEANINIAFPDYTIPFTAAHELAHQRGIAREDEANFVAFLVCSRSSDAYIRYCAYANLYSYVVNALYVASPELYAASYEKLSDNVRAERAAYSVFYQKYANSAASQVSQAINNTFLESQGTPGTVSYGMVVDLAVAYYRDAS